MNNNIFNIDNLIKVIPGMILFYSFIFIYGYYDVYDINVASIYSVEELLLGFLPIIRPLAVLTLMSFLIPLTIHVGSDYFDTSKHFTRLKESWKQSWNGNKLVFKSLVKWFRIGISTPAVAFFILWKGLVLIINLVKPEPMQKLLFFYMVDVLFLIFVYQAIQMFIQWQPRFKNVSVKVIVFGLTILLGAKFFDSFGRVLATTESDKVSSISFLYEGKSYSTDDNLVPLGDTKKYIILRDKCESINLFFEREKVRNLITQ